MQEIAFQSDGLNIRGVLAVPPSRRTGDLPGVIVFHGMTSSSDSYLSLLESLLSHEIAGLAISMRGHGKSDGDFNSETVAMAVNDAIAAYDFFISYPGIDRTRIGAVGSSVGAVLAMMMSKKRELVSIVLRAPAAYTPDMLQLTMAETMVNEKTQFHKISNLRTTPAAEAVDKFRGNLLVVVSEDDSVIPMTVSKGYIDIADRVKEKQLKIIGEATHALTKPEWKIIFNNAAVSWFEKTLRN